MTPGSTTSGRIVIIGAGGFGREVLDIVEAINEAGGSLEFIGFLDDGPVDVDRLMRKSVCGESRRNRYCAIDIHKKRYSPPKPYIEC